MISKKILFLFLITSFYSFAQLKNYYQQHIVYNMDIDVDVEKFTYKGKQNIIYTNNSPDELKVVYFHLYWNAFQPNSMLDQRIQYLGNEADKRMTKDVSGKRVSRIKDLAADKIGYQRISKLLQNGKNVKFEVQGTILKVELSEPIKPNSSTKFDMEWTSQVPEQIRRSGRNNAEGIALSMTQWYPKMAEYDYEGWHCWDYIGREFHGVYGDFNVNISIDKNYIIGAGGVLQNPKEVKGYDENSKIVTKNNKAIWKWKANNIHDFAWAADPDYFVDKIQVPDGPLVYLVYQKNEKTLIWEQTKPKVSQFFTIMNNEFGKYLYPSYSFIQGGDGGMEYGMCSLILGQTNSLPGLCSLMFHEGAHSWYQHIIGTNESIRQWMDEGFTTYAEEYTMSKIFPENYKNSTHFMSDTKNNLTRIQNENKEEMACRLADHFETGRGYGNAAYTKGAMFLAQLGYIMGEENLHKTLREYYKIWKLKHPIDTDFLHIAQTVSGMDLKWFLNYMIYTTEKINYTIKNVQADGKSTLILLERIEKFPMPIDLYITLNNGTIKRFTIPLNMTRGAKKSENGLEYTVLPYWEWTATQYNSIIPIPFDEIQKVEIDATGRLADIDPNTNMWKK